jgi:hypothetical protein
MPEAAARTPPSPLIWYGVLGAPVAWAIEGLLGWLLMAGSCPTGSPAGFGGAPTILGARPILFGIAAAALLTALGALAVGIREWAGSQDRGITAIQSRERGDYLAAIAVLASFVFTLAILLQSASLFVLPTCEVMR